MLILAADVTKVTLPEVPGATTTVLDCQFAVSPTDKKEECMDVPLARTLMLVGLLAFASALRTTAETPVEGTPPTPRTVMSRGLEVVMFDPVVLKPVTVSAI